VDVAAGPGELADVPAIGAEDGAAVAAAGACEPLLTGPITTARPPDPSPCTGVVVLVVVVPPGGVDVALPVTVNGLIAAASALAVGPPFDVGVFGGRKLEPMAQ